jgi:hypothetical protein
MNQAALALATCLATVCCLIVAAHCEVGSGGWYWSLIAASLLCAVIASLPSLSASDRPLEDE